MYALIWKSGHVVWREQWYTFTSKGSLQVDLYMTWGPGFVANVVVTDPTQEIGASSVISQPTCAIAKFSAIINIYKYRRLHEGHHFIPMALEV